MPEFIEKFAFRLHLFDVDVHTMYDSHSFK